MKHPVRYHRHHHPVTYTVLVTNILRTILPLSENKQECILYGSGIGVWTQGLGAAAPDSGKAIIFRTKAEFFGQKPAAKNEDNVYFLYFIKR